jgi:hypothetical protein
MYADLVAKGYRGTREQARAGLNGIAHDHTGLHTNTSVTLITSEGKEFSGGMDHHYRLERPANAPNHYIVAQRIQNPGTDQVIEFTFQSDVTPTQVRFPRMQLGP